LIADPLGLADPLSAAASDWLALADPLSEALLLASVDGTAGVLTAPWLSAAMWARC
jgi:hypothetical protein